MRSASIQFAWFTKEEARISHDRLGPSADTYGDRLALLNRATRITSTPAERLASKLYRIHNHNGRRTMKKIHCSLCGNLVGVVDLPSPESVKTMLQDAGKQKNDAKTAIILASAQTLLPMLPPDAYDILLDAMPHYCPACVVEHNIMGGTGEKDATQQQGQDGKEGPERGPERDEQARSSGAGGGGRGSSGTGGGNLPRVE